MHPNNIHNTPYNFELLCNSLPELVTYVFVNEYGRETIDFANNEAVFLLNKALLRHHYGVSDWSIPKNYLCPPIPGRADYIHYISDLLAADGITERIKGLDIGVGANCIYPILGASIYDWKMVGVDISETAVLSARNNVKDSGKLSEFIQIRHQTNNADLFKGIISENEYFHFSMCNPPFHSSKEEAARGTMRKLKNLKNQLYHTKNDLNLNFGGQANELWCNGGEAVFIKRLIKQSVAFGKQVGWFTTLVSKKDNLNKIYKQLDKLKANHKTIEMHQGNKHSRFVAWKFD